MTQLGNQGERAQPGVPLYGEFALDARLALAFVDALLLNPPSSLSAPDFVELMAWRTGLAEAVPANNRGARPAFPVRARTLLDAACRQATQTHPNWYTGSQAVTTSALAANPKSGVERLPDELWNALFAPSNIGGTVSQGALLLDSLLHSIPLTWRVKLQGGSWELYDANSSARRHAFGKAAKLKYPPRMKLRVQGAQLKWLPAGARANGGSVRIPTPKAKNLTDAIRIAEASTMKLIPKVAHSALPLRGLLGGNAVGALLTFGPQAYFDARDTGVLDDPSNQKNLDKFVVASATSQSANAFGMLTSIAAGLAIATVVSSAPVLIIVGIAAGATGQAAFNAFGASEWVGKQVESLISR